MTDRFSITEIQIPPGLPGISDLFAGLALCNNGSIVVAYRKPIIVDGVNVGDETIFQAPYGRFPVPPGYRVALDVRKLP